MNFWKILLEYTSVLGHHFILSYPAKLWTTKPMNYILTILQTLPFPNLPTYLCLLIFTYLPLPTYQDKYSILYCDWIIIGH